MDWKNSLLRLGRLNSMCTENIESLRKCKNKTEAIKLYKKTIDWALEHNYPNIEIIRAEFGNCQSDGIFVGEVFNGELLNESQVYVFHECKGTIKVGLNPNQCIIPMLYFANNCDISVEGIDSNRVRPDIIPCYIFGENNVFTKNDKNATFKIYKT